MIIVFDIYKGVTYITGIHIIYILPLLLFCVGYSKGKVKHIFQHYIISITMATRCNQTMLYVSQLLRYFDPIIYVRNLVKCVTIV